MSASGDALWRDLDEAQPAKSGRSLVTRPRDLRVVLSCRATITRHCARLRGSFRPLVRWNGTLGNSRGFRPFLRCVPSRSASGVAPRAPDRNNLRTSCNRPCPRLFSLTADRSTTWGRNGPGGPPLAPHLRCYGFSSRGATSAKQRNACGAGCGCIWFAHGICRPGRCTNATGFGSGAETRSRAHGQSSACRLMASNTRHSPVEWHFRKRIPLCPANVFARLQAHSKYLAQSPYGYPELLRVGSRSWRPTDRSQQGNSCE